MNLQDTKTLIDFHYWARDRALDAAEKLSREEFTRELGGSFGSVRNTLVHILSAEFVWLARWAGETPNAMLKPDAYGDVKALRSAWAEQESRLRAYFAKMDEAGIQQSIQYKNLTGQEFSSILWQMLQHVVNHATYHRGQVTTLLRQLNAAPPQSMDLIAYYREIS